MQEGQKAYIEARLYYQVYICDHHFSIAYGRPPLTSDDEAVRSRDRFLESPLVVEDDQRLISQVEIWSITSQVYRTFGTDSAHPVPLSMISHLRRYNISLDTWRADWYETFSVHNQIGNYPQKGVGLHYYFAKLYLCSHAFRGLSKSTASTYHIPPEMVEIAETAIASATYILRTIVTDVELPLFFNGLPLYFDTMIAFAVVFLLKISTDYAGIIQVDATETLSLVRQNMAVIQEAGSRLKSEHLLVRIGEGIRILLERYKSIDNKSSSLETSNDYEDAFAPSHIATRMEDNMTVTSNGFHGFDLDCYDLLDMSANTLPQFDQWFPNFQGPEPLEPWQ